MRSKLTGFHGGITAVLHRFCPVGAPREMGNPPELSRACRTPRSRDAESPLLALKCMHPSSSPAACRYNSNSRGRYSWTAPSARSPSWSDGLSRGTDDDEHAVRSGECSRCYRPRWLHSRFICMYQITPARVIWALGLPSAAASMHLSVLRRPVSRR